MLNNSYENKKFYNLYGNTKVPVELNNLEKEKKKKKHNWRNQPSWLQTILQSCSNQKSKVLAQKLYYRSMNKLESSELSPQNYGKLIFDKRSRIYDGENAAS